MRKMENLNLMDYIEDAAKVGIGLMNVDQQETNMATHYHSETPWGTSCRSLGKMWSGHCQSLWRKHSPPKKKLKNSGPVVKNILLWMLE